MWFCLLQCTHEFHGAATPTSRGKLVSAPRPPGPKTVYFVILRSSSLNAQRAAAPHGDPPNMEYLPSSTLSVDPWNYTVYGLCKIIKVTRCPPGTSPFVHTFCSSSLSAQSITRGAVLHSFTVVGTPSLKQAPRIPPAAAPLGATCQALCTSWMSTVVASQA